MPKPSRDPWIAIDATIRKNAKMADLPSDAARWGWIAILGEAKLQRPQGRFASLAHFTEAAGRFTRFLRDYYRVGLLEPSSARCDRCNKAWGPLPHEGIVVHDWATHQRDPGAAERTDGWRDQTLIERSLNADQTLIERSLNADQTLIERSLNADQTLIEQGSVEYPPRAHVVTVTETVTETVTPSSEGGPAGKPRPPSPAQKAKAWLRDHDIAQPVGWQVSTLNELAKSFGPDAVIAAFEEARTTGVAVTCKNYVQWAESSLAPGGKTAAAPKGHTRPAQEVIDAFNR